MTSRTHGLTTSTRWLATRLKGACALGALALMCAAAHGAATGADDPNAQDNGPLVLEVGHSEILTPPWPVSRVSVIRPAVADVQVLTPRQILIMGNQIGTTDLILWGEREEELWRRRLEVVTDLGYLQDELERLFPTAELELTHSRGKVVVRGVFRRAEDVELLRSLMQSHEISYTDMTYVAGVQQVLLQVRVAEVSRNAMRVLGFNFFQAGNDFFGANVVGSSAGPLVPVNMGVPAGAPASSGLPFEFLAPAGVGPAITLFGGIPRADFQFFVQALMENQYLRVLAEPTLVALSGETATFLAGGEFPIPVVQGGGAAGSITVEYREFGVNLVFRPIVLGDNSIRLYVAPEVSDLTEVGAVVIQGFQIPGVFTRRAETTLELKSGQTFMMAGLLNNRTDARASRTPLLGDLPILGPLFRSVRYTRGDTELAIMVTASLVDPISTAHPLPTPGMLHVTPNDWELFADGLIEGRGQPRLSRSDMEYLRQMNLHRLRGPGGWAGNGNGRVESAADSEAYEPMPEHAGEESGPDA